MALGFHSTLFAKCSGLLRDSIRSSSQICEQLAKNLRTWYGAGVIQARLRPEQVPDKSKIGRSYSVDLPTMHPSSTNDAVQLQASTTIDAGRTSRTTAVH